ncbi:MAG TPA: NAD(P)H-hydrate dehydratase [Clostridiaceae bacterium]|nr:NAD(P)H-hydrate dehydratase [Clostridiaceae bacterium]
MLLVTPEQMSKIDKYSIEVLGIPGIVLMENAALKVVEEILKMLDGKVSGTKIIILAGKGNNGGDALAVARHLYNKGAETSIYILSEKDKIRGDAAINLGILENIGVESKVLIEQAMVEVLKRELLEAGLVVDGIFGTGIKGEVTGLTAEIINIVNEFGKKIISIDIPSGVNGENGRVMGTCIKADRTVTFGLPKIGLVIHPGCEYTGELVIADIGFPSKAIEHFDINAYMLDEEMVSAVLPLRRKNTNKGDYGRVLILTGSTGMTGSGCLAARAALRSGAGLVYLGVPKTLAHLYGAGAIEAITLPLEDCSMGSLSSKCIGQVEKFMSGKDVIAVGPGLSVSDDIFEVMEYIISTSEAPLVLDADALNAVSRDVSIFGKLKAEAVITPHPGEFSRLAGISIGDVQKNRIEVARDFARKWKVITVLKGSRTVVAGPDGTVYINTTGNPGMATAGAGDVLTGVIAALIGQGVKPLSAAAAGVYIHGLAGDLAALETGEISLVAGDIATHLPDVFKRVKMHA